MHIMPESEIRAEMFRRHRRNMERTFLDGFADSAIEVPWEVAARTKG